MPWTSDLGRTDGRKHGRTDRQMDGQTDHYRLPAEWVPNKLESTLPQNSATQITAFLAHWFIKKIFFKLFSLYSYVKNRPHCDSTVPRGF